jgi:kynurenine 3-monooxygenase
MEKRIFLISGAGVAGLLTAALLGRQGHSVIVVEKRARNSTSETSEGRTVNFTLSERGRQALQAAGILDQVLSASVRLKARTVHHFGFKMQSLYGLHSEEQLDCVERSHLHQILLKEALAEPTVQFLFESEILSLDTIRKIAIITTGTREQSMSFDLLIGCDGVHSKTRKLLEAQSQVKTTLSVSDWKYTETTLTKIPPGLVSNSMHVWPRWNYVLCGLPTHDGRLILNRIFKSTAAHKKKAESIVRLKVHPWTIDGSVILIGDSAHAISPFLGQGMNMALEDAIRLVELLYASNISADALERFALSRAEVSNLLFEKSEKHFKFLARKLLNPVSVVIANLICRLRLWAPAMFKSAYTNLTGPSL